MHAASRDRYRILFMDNHAAKPSTYPRRHIELMAAYDYTSSRTCTYKRHSSSATLLDLPETAPSFLSGSMYGKRSDFPEPFASYVWSSELEA